MAAEVHALVHASDKVYHIREAPYELLGRDVELEAFVNNPTLFNVVAKMVARRSIGCKSTDMH